MHTCANRRFNGEWDKYVELYISTLPANRMSDHICEIILVRSCRDRFTFRLSEKSPSFHANWFQTFNTNCKKKSTGKGHLKAHPHLYAGANKACETEANANKCQKVACSAFTAQANEQTFRWSFVGCPNECTSTSVQLRTYFSLKYRLQMDSVRLFAEHTPHKRMKTNAVRQHIHIIHSACVFVFVLHSCTNVDAA